MAVDKQVTIRLEARDDLTPVLRRAAASADALAGAADKTAASLTRIGAIWSYYTGYMSAPKIVGDRTGQTINLQVESYLAFFGKASNRTYLDQQSYDPDDRSAELAIAIANGASRRRASMAAWENSPG